MLVAHASISSAAYSLSLLFVLYILLLSQCLVKRFIPGGWISSWCLSFSPSQIWLQVKYLLWNKRKLGTRKQVSLSTEQQTVIICLRTDFNLSLEPQFICILTCSWHRKDKEQQIQLLKYCFSAGAPVQPSRLWPEDPRPATAPDCWTKNFTALEQT